MVDDNTKKILKEILQKISSANSSLSGVATNTKLEEVIDAVGDIDAGGLPDQTGNSGKFLTTDGSDPSWASIPGGGDMLASVYDPQAIAADVFDVDNHTDGTTNKVYTASEQSKLSGIETNADVTDATNVATAGAFMKSTDDLDDITAGSTNKHFTSSDESKLDGIESGADVTDTTNVDAAGAVMNSDYDANTILAATSDNTPAALTVGTQTVVGRAGGNIAALSIDSDLSSVSGSDDTIPSAKATKAALDLKAPIASPTFTGTVTLPTGLTGVIRTDSGVVSVDSDVTDIVAAATTGAAGKVELATTAETETGTDTARAVTPDGLHDMTTLSGAAWFLDEDDMSSDSAVKTASQQSIKAYVGTAPKSLSGLNDIRSKAFFLPSPAATDDIPIVRFDTAITLTKVVYALGGTTNWVGQVQEADDAQGTSGADTQASDSTVTGTTSVTSFSNASLDAGDYLRLKTTSVSGTPDWLHVTIYYTIN